MAWVTQRFTLGTLDARLESGCVVIGNLGYDLARWEPKTKEEAHGMALILRRAARRLEEIGKELV